MIEREMQEIFDEMSYSIVNVGSASYYTNLILNIKSKIADLEKLDDARRSAPRSLMEAEEPRKPQPPNYRVEDWIE